jgi:hypothetical protein
MELLYWEDKARTYGGCAVIIASFFLGSCFSILSLGLFLIGGWAWLPAFFSGAFAAFLLFGCIRYIRGFLNNKVERFGICNDVIWWDVPFFPRRAGFIPLNEVCKLTICADAGKLKVTKRDGTIQRIPWSAWNSAAEQLRAVLIQHYPSIAIEFIERIEG